MGPLFEPLFQPAAMHQLLFQQPTGLSSGRPTAAMQVVEHEHEYRVEIDAPGLAPRDIKVAIDDGILSGAVVYSERRSSAFARRIALPENHDPKEIAARAQDGVVSIVIKKKPEDEQISKRREIPVEGQALSSPSGAQQEGEQAVPVDHE